MKLFNKTISSTEGRRSYYRALVGMNMAGKHKIDFVFNKPGLKHHSHAFSFHEMVIVTVVPWRVKKNNEPWSFRSVNLWELFRKPLVLWSFRSVNFVNDRLISLHIYKYSGPHNTS